MNRDLKDFPMALLSLSNIFKLLPHWNRSVGLGKQAHAFATLKEPNPLETIPGVMRRLYAMDRIQIQTNRTDCVNHHGK